jgi:hypothetical protein
MQFKVPQNISMEDKIAGPLTMVQFIILIVGGAFAYAELKILSPFQPANEIIAGLIATLTCILTLTSFNGQPMYKFFRFFIAFLLTPRTRVWHKGAPAVNLVNPAPKVVKEEKKAAEKHVSKDDIARLAQVLDSRGTSGLPPQGHTK